MKDEHLDLFVDLLVEKIGRLDCELADTRAKLFAPVKSADDYADLKKKYDDIKADYEVLQENFTQLQKNFDKVKESGEKKPRNGDLNAYKLMVQYAKAKGFKFARLDVMKHFVENPVEEQTSEQSADEKPPAPAAPPKKKEPVKIDFDSHTRCPNSMHNMRGNVVDVGSKECQRCPFFGSVNYDETYVECNMNP